MKKYFIGFLFGIVGGVFAFGLLRGLETASRPIAQIVTPSPTPTPTPLDLWQKFVSDASLSTVVVQNFQNNKLRKQGSGLILSSDGLIVTTSDIAFGGALQILYEDKILNGKLVFKDQVNNLALLKVDAANLNISALDKPGGYESGQEYMLTGKLANLSKPVIFSQRASGKYILDDRIALDTNPDMMLNGAKVLNHKGETVGMVYLSGKEVYLIRSKTIDDFYNKFLNR